MYSVFVFSSDAFSLFIKPSNTTPLHTTTQETPHYHSRNHTTLDYQQTTKNFNTNEDANASFPPLTAYSPVNTAVKKPLKGTKRI